MTDKITLGSMVSFQNDNTATVQYNSNNALITTAFDNTLSRDGTSPNQMGSNLDMNSFPITNLPQPLSALSPLRLQDLNTFIGGGTLSTIPAGGTSGQVLVKSSNADFNVGWGSTPVLSVPNTWTALNTFSNSAVVTGTLTVNGAIIDNSGNVGAPSFKLNGATSGIITVQPQAIAGTYNFNLPTTAGSFGSVLQSGGGGTTPMTWSTATYPTSGASGTVITSNGTNWIPTTATYPVSTVINQLLFSNATNTIVGLTTANNSALITNSSGVPSLGVVPVVAGGTGDTGTAFTTYTPTATPVGGGTFTTVTATGRYKQIGKLLFFQINTTITAIGSGSGPLAVTLPLSLTAAGTYVVVGRDQTSGKSLNGYVLAGSNIVNVAFYDNTTIVVNGNNPVISGVIEVQ